MTPSPSAQDLLLAKVRRIRSGGAPRVLELASGCGGLSLGFERAGFELTAHVELDPVAARTYAVNLGREHGPGDPWASPRDMLRCTAEELVAELGLTGIAGSAFDVLAAGLPCQAFARIGRSKLRAVAGDGDAFLKDPRGGLYRRFLEFAAATKPLAIVIENVPDILNYGGKNVPGEICDRLEEMGYAAAYTILNAAHFGVPQIRERLFVIALAKQLGVPPAFPNPSNSLDLPSGYEGSRRVALKHVLPGDDRFLPIHEPSVTLPRAVTAREAIGDLPYIVEHLSEPATIKRRALSEGIPYRADFRFSAYAQAMRAWPNHEAGSASNGHLTRLTPRDYPIFRRMPNGADYPIARNIAEQMLRDASAGRPLTDDDLTALRKAVVPPYDPTKFPNKWWKMHPDKPSRTVTAHVGKDTYSHIHYDSEQARTISVREAARLQSFPDAFQFEGAMNAAFRQIGNAVPPLVALALASTLRRQLQLASVDTDAGPRVA